MPDALILCYEMGRKSVYGMEEVPLPDLGKFKELYELMANVMHPCKVIGIGINGRKFSDEEVRREKERVEKEFGVPAADVLRHGSDSLIKAVLEFKKKIGK